MKFIECVGSFLLFIVAFVQDSHPSFHPKMGAPHVLDPKGEWFVTATSSNYGEVPFSSSKNYTDLLVVYKEAEKEFIETEDLQKKDRLKKIMEVTNRALIRLSLNDRQEYKVKNKVDMRRYKSGNQFFPLNSLAAAEKSGALLWAHRHGILGKGASVFVIEQVGYLPPDIPLSKLIKTTDIFPPEGDRRGSTHHEQEVASVVYQMAPQAQIVLVKDSQLDIFFHPNWRESIWDKAREKEIFPKHPFIMNWSGGDIPESRAGGINSLFENRSQVSDLLVKAVPNTAGMFGDREIDKVFNEKVFNLYFAQIILVGNLDNYGDLPVKPFNERQQQRFLCAYGNGVLVQENKTVSGTSFAAPTVSGTAALLQSKYPQLSPQEIGNILLESADRTFWTGGSLIYDPQDFPEGDPARLLRFPENVRLRPFDSKKYGRGVLSLRRAFLYADLKVKHPRMSSEELAPLFKAAIQTQEEEAAQKIQKAFRAYKRKKPL